MSYVIAERVGSRDVSASSATREYVVRRADPTDSTPIDHADFLGDLESLVPSTFAGLPINPVGLRLEEVGDRLWYATVAWGDGRGGDAASDSFGFDVSGQTVQFTHSYETISQTRADGDTPTDFRQAINVVGEGPAQHIQGTSVVVPQATFTRSIPFSIDKAFSSGWFRNICAIAGSVNDSTYEGFASGELLLSRVGGQQINTTQFRVDFGFAFSENVTNLAVGGVTVPAKRGWDFVWTRSEMTGDPPERRVVQANVERVYRYKSWNILSEINL